MARKSYNPYVIGTSQTKRFYGVVNADNALTVGEQFVKTADGIDSFKIRLMNPSFVQQRSETVDDVVYTGKVILQRYRVLCTGRDVSLGDFEPSGSPTMIENPPLSARGTPKAPTSSISRRTYMRRIFAGRTSVWSGIDSGKGKLYGRTVVNHSTGLVVEQNSIKCGMISELEGSLDGPVQWGGVLNGTLVIAFGRKVSIDL